MRKNKAATAIYNKIYHASHQEAIRARARLYREAHRKEDRVHAHVYYRAHREERQRYNRAYYQAKRDEILAYAKGYYEKNRNRVRISHLAKNYGITPDIVESMLQTQGGGCAICHAEKWIGRHNGPVIDHDHGRKGRIRGILCSRCNTGLGQFRDNPDFLRAAARYIEQS